MDQARKENESEYLISPIENWENWRIKSLNSHPLERYLLPIATKTTQPPIKRKGSEQLASVSMQDPVPKITKINEHCFCILINNAITLFTYVEEAERSGKKKSTFLTTNVEILLPPNTEWVAGDGTNKIYISSPSEILVMQVEKSVEKDNMSVVEICRKRLDKIKGISFIKSNYSTKLVVLTEAFVYTYNTNKNYDLINEFPIEFSDESSGWQNINQINGIAFIFETLNTFYFMGTTVELKADVRVKLGRGESKEEPKEKKCEVLYITKFEIKQGKIEARIFIIDHIFETGIFKKARAHQVGNETFVLSLYEEIIVIRKNFSKFMVWDNVTIASSKSNEKKGQLILADKRIMVYTETGEIYAHELFFNFQKAKLETPRIDSFKGNGNEEEILYDALVFEYKDETYMKVLFYFKEAEIYTPNKKHFNSQDAQNSNLPKDHMQFQIICIEQSEPTEKLKELLQTNKSQEEIHSFLKRFHINDLRFKKSEWEVSGKGEKEIETLLLEIGDNEYIQTELTKILKEKPHDLLFLIGIEKKQIERYRLMLAGKLLKYEEDSEGSKKNIVPIEESKLIGLQVLSELFLMREMDEIKLSMQWLLESKMFEQKLHYSMNFMSFKEYDFMEIGKLRTASLREEIKLLGVKGFEKRLKYFLNSFKYLVLDDFKSILRFVVGDLSEGELKVFFIKSFPFILPTYNQIQGEDRCKLWDDTFKEDEPNIETVKLFKSSVTMEMGKLTACLPSHFLKVPLEDALQAFDELFNEFMKSNWFVLNSYKQHSLLRHSIEELKELFEELKEIGVLNIIIELMYEKIEEGSYSELKVKEVIGALKKENFLTETFNFNIEARLEVYTFVISMMSLNKKLYCDLHLPSKPKLIIMKEPAFFELLFDNFQEYLIVEIKRIYEEKRKGFFLENYRKFLNSPLPNLTKLIHFMDQFKKYQKYEEGDGVHFETFECICRLMNLTDTENSRTFIEKIIELPTSSNQNLSGEKTISEAKLVFASYFANLFIKFDIKAKHLDLINETSSKTIKEAKILLEILAKYTQDYIQQQESHIIEFEPLKVIQERVDFIDLSKLVDFFSIVLYLHYMTHYEFDNVEIIQTILTNFFELDKFEEARTLIDNISDFGKVFDERVLIEEKPHYKILNDFKHEHDIKKVFEETVLEWVAHKYTSLSESLKKDEEIRAKEKEMQERNEQSENKDDLLMKKENVKEKESINKNSIFVQINKTFLSISSLLKILNFYIFNERVEQEINRISLFENIKKLNPELLRTFLDSLISEQVKYKGISSFIFLINLLGKVKDAGIFNLEEKKDILELLSCLSSIHKEYNIVFQKDSKKNDEILLGELCRFYSEFTFYLVDHKMPIPAGYVLLDLINSSYFYRDAVLYYFSRTLNPKQVPLKIYEKLVHDFMNAKSHELKKIFNECRSISSSPINSEEIPQNIKILYSLILQNNQLDEATFFCIRNTQIEIEEFEQIATESAKYHTESITANCLLAAFIRNTKNRIEGQNYPTFMLFKSRLNALMRPTERMEVIKDIFIMMNQLEIDVLRSRCAEFESKIKMGSKAESEKLSKEEKVLLSRSYLTLKEYYHKFMKMEKLSPWLSISTEEIEPTAVRIEKYPEYSVSEVKQSSNFKNFSVPKEEESQEIKDLRKKMFDNEQRLKEIQYSNRELLEEQIRPAITEVKMKAEKEYLSIIENKKKKDEDHIIEDGNSEETSKLISHTIVEDEIEKLYGEEKEKVAEIQNHKSKIVQETENLMMELRERRKKVREETTVTFDSEHERKNEEIKAKKTGHERQPSIANNGSIGEDFRHSVVGSKVHFESKININTYDSQVKDKTRYFEDESRRSMVAAREEMRERFEMLKESQFRPTISKLFSDKNSEFYVPKWEAKTPMRLQFDLGEEKNGSKSSRVFDKVKSELAIEAEREKQSKEVKLKSKNITFSEISKRMKTIGEKEVSELVEKLQSVLHSPSAGSELIRNMYSNIKEISVFLGLCNDLLLASEEVNNMIEHKSLKLVEDAMKTKIPIQYKEMFPAIFFTSVHATSMRDYYHIAYGIIKPNLIKLMQQNTNVSGLAMVVRLGFGSDPTFYFKVYEDNIRAVLDAYDTKGDYSDNKQLMLLAEKMRLNYGNLNSDNRKIKFEQLVMEIKSKEKRKNLIKAMMVNLENKSSLVNKESFEEFRVVLANLEQNT